MESAADIAFFQSLSIFLLKSLFDQLALIWIHHWLFLFIYKIELDILIPLYLFGYHLANHNLCIDNFIGLIVLKSAILGMPLQYSGVSIKNV